MNVDWSALFTLNLSPWETLARGTILYWFIMLLLRLAGRRDAGTLGMADLLVMVLIGDAAGNAMLPESGSVADAMLLIATIIGWSAVIDRVCFFFPRVESWLQPRKVCLVKDGALQRRGMRREYVTAEEIMQAIRLAGLEHLAQVRRAYVESDGQISVIAADGGAHPRSGLRSAPE